MAYVWKSLIPVVFSNPKPCCIVLSYKSSSLPAVSVGGFWVLFYLVVWEGACQLSGTDTASSLCVSSGSNGSQHARWPLPDGLFVSLWYLGCPFSPFCSGASSPGAVLWGVKPWQGHRELPDCTLLFSLDLPASISDSAELEWCAHWLLSQPWAGNVVLDS